MTESNHKKIADIFNKYFANVVTSLKIPEFWHYWSTFRKHIYLNLHLKHLSNIVIILVFMKLKHKKATQGSDIPVKVLKENTDFLLNIFIYSLMKQLNLQFPSLLKQAMWLCQFSKNVAETRKRTTDQLLFSRYYLKYLKRYYWVPTIVARSILKMYYQSFNVVLERGLVLNTVYY